MYSCAEIFDAVKICGGLSIAQCHLIEEIPANLKRLWHFRLLVADNQFGWMYSIWRSYSEFQKVLRVCSMDVQTQRVPLNIVVFYKYMPRHRKEEKAPLSLPQLEGKVTLSRGLCKANVPRRYLLLSTLRTETGIIKGGNIQIMEKHPY